MTTQPITIYLIGHAGVGKYTIAKELSNFDFKVVDNHLINNPIFSLLDLDDITPIKENAWETIGEIRKSILGFVCQDTLSNYVFTNELQEEKCDHVIYNQVKNAAEARGSIFIPVKLIINDESEHKERISNPQRKERFKKTTLPLDRIAKELIQIQHPNLQELDVTNLTPGQAVERLLEFAKETIAKLSLTDNTEQVFIDESGNESVNKQILEGLNTYNESTIGPYNSSPFTVFIKSKNSGVVAGLNGDIYGDVSGPICRIHCLWGEEKRRQQGLGTKLFNEIEKFAISKNCKMLQLYTAEFQAKEFYEKKGFLILAVLENGFRGHALYFMRKML